MKNKWTRLACAWGIAVGVLLGMFLSGSAHAEDDVRGIVIGQRHFDAYCTYLLVQQAAVERSDCPRREGRVLMVKADDAEAAVPDCNADESVKRKPARASSRIRYTLRYVQP